MLARVRTHVRSNVVGYIALFFAISGGAYAASVAPRNSVATKSIKNNAVTTPKIRNGAVKTNKIGDAAVATGKLADSAVTVTKLADGSVTTSKFAPSAIAPNATHASNADSLGQDSAIAVTQAVQQISTTPAAGSNTFTQLGHGLQLAAICHDGGQVKMIFQNIGPSGATLNWIYSDGSASVNANGATVPAGGEQDFTYNTKRLEGQFIWSGDGVTTVNLHAYDGTSSCEVRGTAEHAAG